jgi:hypothetical protein
VLVTKVGAQRDDQGAGSLPNDPNSSAPVSRRTYAALGSTNSTW